MLDPGDDCVQRGPSRAREEQSPRPTDRGVAKLHDVLRPNVGQEADRDRVRDVDVVGESAREIDVVELGWRDAKVSQQDRLAAGVGRLGLSQVAGVLARQGDATNRLDDDLASSVTEHAHGCHPPVPTKFGEEVYEAGPADPFGRHSTDGLEMPGVAVETRPLDGPVGARHPVAH